MLYEHLSLLSHLVSSKIGISLNESQLKQFSIYADLLIDWNEKVNLTSIIDPEEIVIKHFLDSLTLTHCVRGERIADIGTGAGFPGIPLKIIYPEKEFLLVDSLAKRLEFIDVVIDELGLQSVQTIHSRAEDFGRNAQYREILDSVVSRAVARLPVLLEYSIPLLKVGGVFSAAKGSLADEEVKESNKALELLGARVVDIQRFNLGSEAEHRSIIVIEKTRKTPQIYPRKAGTPGKKPL